MEAEQMGNGGEQLAGMFQGDVGVLVRSHESTIDRMASSAPQELVACGQISSDVDN